MYNTVEEADATKNVKSDAYERGKEAGIAEEVEKCTMMEDAIFEKGFDVGFNEGYEEAKREFHTPDL